MQNSDIDRTHINEVFDTSTIVHQEKKISNFAPAKKDNAPDQEIMKLKEEMLKEESEQERQSKLLELKQIDDLKKQQDEKTS